VCKQNILNNIVQTVLCLLPVYFIQAIQGKWEFYWLVQGIVPLWGNMRNVYKVLDLSLILKGTNIGGEKKTNNKAQE
jgi:hypothetical protein